MTDAPTALTLKSFLAGDPSRPMAEQIDSSVPRP